MKTPKNNMKIVEELIDKDIFLDIRLTMEEIEKIKDFIFIENCLKIGNYTLNIGLMQNEEEENEEFL